MVVISHPTGNINVREAALALLEKHLLDEFHTCIAACGGNIFEKLAALPGLAQIKRRTCFNALSPYLRLDPWREIGRLFAERLGIGLLTQLESAIFSIDAVYRSFDGNVAKQIALNDNISAVYCYEDGAWETFLAAKKKGLKCIYEHPVGYWRKVHEISLEESQIQPAWSQALPSLKDSQEKLHRKDDELQLADHIIVPSSYSRSSLQNCPFQLAPISVVPYGMPRTAHFPKKVHFNKKGKLKVIFVGGLNQLKGISYLFDAIHLLESAVQLTIIGRKTTNHCKKLNDTLENHRWIPSLPHDQILSEMRNHDVLVLPSLSDGFGMVITEALSQGIPVITTQHTCGPDIITDDVNGFIVPIRSAEAIAEKLEKLHINKSKLLEMRLEATSKAEKFTWSTYRQSVSTVVDSILQFPKSKSASIT